MRITDHVKLSLILSFFLAFFHALPVGAQTTHKLYVFINDVKSDVEILKADTQEWAPADTKSMISEGDQIRTGPFSSVSLVFADSSFVLVDSFSHLTINKFSVTENVVDTNLFLSVGSIISTLNDNVSFGNKYIIGTPTSITSLGGGEIKKVVAGAMYRDTVKTDYRKDININGQTAGTISREKERQKESSISPNPKQ